MSKPLYKDQHGTVYQFLFSKPVVLLVEDDRIYLDLRRKVLEKDGYRVIGVSNTEDALDTLREAPICCTIADHMLQGSTGVDLAVEMKKIKPDVPIILFSGSMPENLRNIDVYVNKGEPTAEFLKIVRNVVQRYRS